VDRSSAWRAAPRRCRPCTAECRHPQEAAHREGSRVRSSAETPGLDALDGNPRCGHKGDLARELAQQGRTDEIEDRITPAVAPAGRLLFRDGDQNPALKILDELTRTEAERPSVRSGTAG